MKKREMKKRIAGIFLAAIMVIGQLSGMDNLLVKAEETWTATSLISNGNFETADSSAGWDNYASEWSITMSDWTNGAYQTKTDSYATNNTTTIFNYSNKGSEAINLSMSRSVASVPAGTYRLAYDYEGATGTSGLTVSIADVSMAVPETTGWNVWSTATTDSFTLTDTTDLTISISGDLPAGYWGDFDNFVLQQCGEDVGDGSGDNNNTTVEYDVTVSASSTEAKAGETVSLTANVTKNGVAVTDLSAEGLQLWWWTDTWNDHTDGLSDASYSNYDSNSGKSLTADVKLPSAGNYYIVGELQDSEGSTIKKVTTTITTTATEGGEETVTYAIEVSASATKVKAGETVSLTANVTKNDEAVTDLSAEGLKLWWWTDTWNDHTDGLSDATYSNYDGNSGLSLTADVTVPSVGTYYIIGELQDADGTIDKCLVTITATDPNAITASDENYTIVVTVDNAQPEVGNTVHLTATVTTSDGTEITDLASNGLELWWWTDTWNHTDGLSDATYSNYDDNSGNSLTADVTLPSVGTYYIVGELKNSTTGTDLSPTVILTSTESETEGYITGEINVEKIKDLPEDFIMGMDISSVMSEFASGVTYKDFEGNTIDNITDFCKFLAENGITHVRVRVWNNPYDADGNGYGGGNCDVATAAAIAEGCRSAGLKMLIDFHCSDFWADPGKQQVPKAWEGYTLEQKQAAVETFISESLATIDPNHQTVDMVQVGNETTGGFVGETSVANMCTLFSAGAKAVHEYNEDVKVVIHVTNPEKGNVTTWAKNLNTYSVDYDVLATSYYPYWHGTLANLQSELATVKETYGKDVMVAETSYAYTLNDSDGHDNTVRVGNNDTGSNTLQPFSVQGQATAIRNVMNTVNAAGGLGVFYWEPAWITVGDTTGLSDDALDTQVAANRTKWEANGSGWAASYAGEYDADDAGKWYGGSAVDNEAMFYPDGTPTAALYVWNYVKTGAISKYTSVESIENPTETINASATFTLPETVTVTYNSGTVDETVAWNTTEAAAINTAVSGTYTVSGTVTFSKTINQGTYNGKTTADVTYTLTVKQPNLITDADDAGFEKGDNFTISGSGISSIPAPDDPYAGTGSMHWYNATATTGIVTYNKVITLEAGKYHFEAVAQGYAGDTVTLQILNTDKEVLFTGDATTLEGWTVWKDVETSFELTETTDVILQMVVGIQDGGWGTADELYLYQEPVVTTPDDDDNVDNGDDGNTNNGDDSNTDNSGEGSIESGSEESTESGNEGSVDNSTGNTGSSNVSGNVSYGSQKHVKEELVASNGKNNRVLTSYQISGAQLVGSENTIPAGADFIITHMGAGTVNYAKAAATVTEHLNGNSGFVVYEMTLLNATGAYIHQLNDYVSVTIPMPAGLTIGAGQQLTVYRLEDDGTLTKCDTTVADGKVTFMTNHFSTYLFVAEAANTSPDTSDNFAATANLALLLFAVGIVMVSVYAKKRCR